MRGRPAPLRLLAMAGPLRGRLLGVVGTWMLDHGRLTERDCLNHPGYPIDPIRR